MILALSGPLVIFDDQGAASALKCSKIVWLEQKKSSIFNACISGTNKIMTEDQD